MSVLPLYDQPSKGDLIEMAREECGLAGYDFPATGEEDRSCLRQLQSMMAAWQENEGLVLGFNFISNGYGEMTDPSGVPAGAMEAVVTSLALRLAPNMGKTLSPESKTALNRSMGALRAKYQVIPPMQMGRGTIRGAGNRWRGYTFGPYFVTDVPSDEIVQ